MKNLAQKIIVVVVCCLAISAQAALSPLSINIVPPIQFPPDDFDVAGLRLSAIWGKHRDVSGFDFSAIGNITTKNFNGLGVAGVFNWINGPTTILLLQAAGVANIIDEKTKVFGLQLAGGMNYLSADASVVGLQIALIGNHAPNANIYGLQVGLYNRAENVYGLQIGLVNFATSLHGVQIGLVNFNHQGLFAVSPILNVGF